MSLELNYNDPFRNGVCLKAFLNVQLTKVTLPRFMGNISSRLVEYTFGKERKWSRIKSRYADAQTFSKGTDSYHTKPAGLILIQLLAKKLAVTLAHQPPALFLPNIIQ